MKIWVLSDVHVELTSGWDLPGPGERPDFDVLVMAGDLVPAMERGVNWLRERVTDRPVIYLPATMRPTGRTSTAPSRRRKSRGRLERPRPAE
jgi:3',5'-cyclic AMP phosphodiesterase CpdA